MECPNCGSRKVSATSLTGYAVCAYCHSQVAVMSPASALGSVTASKKRDIVVAEDDLAQLSVRLQIAARDLEDFAYEEAKRSYEDILADHPFCWEAMAGCAIAKFWLGREDLEHMNDVVILLNRAEEVSGASDSVLSIKRQIGFNLAVIAQHKERFGEKLFWAISCLKYSKSLCPNFVERDDIADQFVNSCHQEIRDRLLKFAARDKKTFDPPETELITLKSLAELSPKQTPEVCTTLLAFAVQKERRKNSDEVRRLVAFAREGLHSSGKKGEPILVFPFFGPPRIEQSMSIT